MPYAPVPYETADVYAIKAVAMGNANEEQQRRAMGWIVNKASALHELSYRPGVTGDRDTAFAEGRRFVGAQIAKMISAEVVKRSSNE